MKKGTKNQFSHLFLEFMVIFSSALKASTKSKKQTENSNTFHFIDRAMHCNERSKRINGARIQTNSNNSSFFGMHGWWLWFPIDLACIAYIILCFYASSTSNL